MIAGADGSEVCVAGGAEQSGQRNASFDQPPPPSPPQERVRVRLQVSR